MREINVQITKAKIENFTVTLEEDVPRITASIALLTENGKKISSFSISSEAYYGSIKFELPPDVIDPVLKISDRLEQIVTQECNKALCLLGMQV